ncbi:MAG: C40 family peptidase [Armatimonadetes bacterium]|nr:C40 family peptidase [Armatimonadota bacterium]
MMLILAVAMQISNPPAVQKAEGAVFAVNTPDQRAYGFAIGNGKYLMTCDYVVGSDSKITIHDGKNKDFFGYLVFHDAKINVAVYRMDHTVSRSLTISAEPLPVGKRFYAIGGGFRFQGTLSGIRQDNGRSIIQIKEPIGPQLPGIPILDAKGIVLGMVQPIKTDSDKSDYGLAASDLDKVLRQNAGPAQPTTFVGKLGRVAEATRVAELPDLDSRTYFVASQGQYLVVDDYNNEFMKVLLPNSTYGYILAAMVTIESPTLTMGTPGVANGYEVLRVVNTFDASTLHATTNEADWRKECARFVALVFSTAGREISNDLDVQLDIGHDVPTADDLQAGDRLYFGQKGKLMAAIYLGNDQYISVGRDGKLVKANFSGDSAKPYFAARH